MNRPGNSLRCTAGLVLAIVLGGCALGPDFKPLPAPAADSLAVSPLPAATVSTPVPGGEAQQFLAGTPVAARWWEQYQSPEINALVEEALKASPSIASAQATLRVAEANHRAQFSTLFPEVEGKFTANRQKIDPGSFGNPGGGGLIYNLYNASVGVSYGLDIWGGTRRGVEASEAAADAKRHELTAAYQALIGNVVTGAITIAENQYLVQGTRILIADHTQRLSLARRQLEVGAISKADVAAVDANLATELANLNRYENQLVQSRTQMAVYLGRTPSALQATDFDLLKLKLPTAIPVSLPSELVRQRPDLLAAEAELHQAAANIGVASANQFPQIALSASIGTQATTLDQLFAGNVWSIGGAITQPLFRAGALSARKRATIAEYDRAEADYRQTVLTAFKNVADSLQALQSNAAALSAYDQFARAAEISYQTAERQHALGAGTLADKMQKHAAFTTARVGYATTVASRLRDTAALYLSLGGDWDTAPQQAAAR